MKKVKVTFALFASLREIAKCKEAVLELPESSTVKEAIFKLGEKYGKELTRKILDERKGGVSEHFRVFVNGRNIIFLKGLETKLKGGERIAIFPPVGGGS